MEIFDFFFIDIYLPIFSNKVDAIKDNTVNETTSPIDAANGVAQLSGLRRIRCERNITATKTKSTPQIIESDELICFHR